MQSIYTDGSCNPNPGRGGWGFIVLGHRGEFEVYGHVKNTTNNRMELTAVIEALKFSNSKQVKIYSDSQLTIKCAQGIWKRKVNLDLWEEFDHVAKKRTIVWEWVRGHNGDVYNERVDKLAKITTIEKKSLS